MKKTLFLLCMPLLMAACQRSTSLVEQVANSNPIMPIRMYSDTTHVVMTDYVPLLCAVDSQEWDNIKWSCGEQMELLHLAGNGHQLQELDIVNKNGRCQTLTLSDGKAGLSIVVLPNKPVRQGLTTAMTENGQVKVCFKEDVQNPQLLAYIQNVPLSQECWTKVSDTEWLLQLPKPINNKETRERTYLRVYAEDEDCLYNDLLLPLENGQVVTEVSRLDRHDPQAQVLYSLLVDRFNNGNPSNDAPLNSPEVDKRVDYMGGDLKGIQQKIAEGWFEQLGINTIWISPITQNPKDAWGQYTDPDTKFSGYHGYWPIYNTKLDDRMGTPEEFRELLNTAHKHNINVILDYVANHMHINSPTLQAHPDWVTDSLLPDGRRNFELWDEARLTTWFDKHIPTLDLEREEVCDNMTDTALYWLENYELDGFRHDACKHIPLNYWRLFTQKMVSRYQGRKLWMIGETYGDPELIGSYVKTGMLNAQFDFNIYHTAIDVLGKGESMNRIADVIDQSLANYGAHHTMGNISGNHDKCRFISLAGGAVAWDENDKDAGWHRQIGVTADGDPAREKEAYKTALLLEVINLTIPGVPCIYQGDEYGQAGANDPDNRRMMRFDGLNENEQWFRGEVEKMIKLRRNNMALLYGDYRRLYCNDDELAFERTYLGQTVTVTINNKTKEYSIVTK